MESLDAGVFWFQLSLSLVSVSLIDDWRKTSDIGDSGIGRKEKGITKLGE